MPTNSQSIPDEPLVNANGKIFRSLAVHPQTGELFISDAIDYMSEGKVYRYSPVGALIDTIDVGIIPGNFCFN